MDPHNVLTFGVTQWDALRVNRGPPNFDDPYATELFNTYLWPMICHTNMRRFLTPDSRPAEHQGFLAVFLDEIGMGNKDDGWMGFLMGGNNPTGIDPAPRLTASGTSWLLIRSATGHTGHQPVVSGPTPILTPWTDALSSVSLLTTTSTRGSRRSAWHHLAISCS
jgi:hypothetical protein